MANSRGTNTQSEALQGILGEIASIKTFPDADIEWLLGIETQILQKLREPVQQAIQNSDIGSQVPQSPGMGGGGMPMTPPPTGGMPMPGGVPGMRSGVGPINPDELRRVVATNS